MKGKGEKKENSQQRNNYLPEYRNSASQASWKGRISAAGKDGCGSITVFTYVLKLRIF